MKQYSTNYKFALYAKVAEVQLQENTNLYRSNSFLKPVFEKPNSYINVLGDIIFVAKSCGEGVTTPEIEERCKCKMTHTINRLLYAGLIERSKTGYVPTSLGRKYWVNACIKFGQQSRVSATYVEHTPPKTIAQLELPL